LIPGETSLIFNNRNTAVLIGRITSLASTSVCLYNFQQKNKAV